MTSAIRIALLALGLASTDAAAGEIELTMSGFSNDVGMARIVLVEGEEGYTSVTPVTLVASVPIKDGQAAWIGEVPPGIYAIIAHHDKNENDELDRPVFELPLEPYGYSNGAWTSLGLPSFKEVAFVVGEGVARQNIQMRTNAFVSLAQIAAACFSALAVLFTLNAIRRRRTARPA